MRHCCSEVRNFGVPKVQNAKKIKVPHLRQYGVLCREKCGDFQKKGSPCGEELPLTDFGKPWFFDCFRNCYESLCFCGNAATVWGTAGCDYAFLFSWCRDSWGSSLRTAPPDPSSRTFYSYYTTFSLLQSFPDVSQPLLIPSDLPLFSFLSDYLFAFDSFNFWRLKSYSHVS